MTQSNDKGRVVKRGNDRRTTLAPQPPFDREHSAL